MMKPALIIVDFQEDFCPPSGTLAVPSGRSIATPIATLLNLSPPIPLIIATQDWHPPTHTSFAANHPDAVPFTSTTTITNPLNPSETFTSQLWPVHCVQHSPGAALVPELDTTKIHAVIKKGMVPEVEMYSAFYDPFTSPRIADTGLADKLRSAEITHVFVVGLAADYCVKATALDAHKEGFKTCIIEEATKPVDVNAWPTIREEIRQAGVAVVSIDGPQVAQLRSL